MKWAGYLLLCQQARGIFLAIQVLLQHLKDDQLQHLLLEDD